jgi:hypothetical protein
VDPLIKSQLLYQLSYAPATDGETPVNRGSLAKPPTPVQFAAPPLAAKPGSVGPCERDHCAAATDR